MEKLKMPSDADLMRTAIIDLNKSTTSLEDRQRALNELLILVEPIDNANGLSHYNCFIYVSSSFLPAFSSFLPPFLLLTGL